VLTAIERVDVNACTNLSSTLVENGRSVQCQVACYPGFHDRLYCLTTISGLLLPSTLTFMSVIVTASVSRTTVSTSVVHHTHPGFGSTLITQSRANLWILLPYVRAFLDVRASPLCNICLAVMIPHWSRLLGYGDFLQKFHPQAAIYLRLFRCYSRSSECKHRKCPPCV
jgi:hypothetical protein